MVFEPITAAEARWLHQDLRDIWTTVVPLPAWVRRAIDALAVQTAVPGDLMFRCDECGKFVEPKNCWTDKRPDQIAPDNLPQLVLCDGCYAQEIGKNVPSSLTKWSAWLFGTRAK